MTALILIYRHPQLPNGLFDICGEEYDGFPCGEENDVRSAGGAVTLGGGGGWRGSTTWCCFDLEIV